MYLLESIIGDAFIVRYRNWGRLPSLTSSLDIPLIYCMGQKQMGMRYPSVLIRDWSG